SFSTLPPPPTPTLFPYTTLFRSKVAPVKSPGRFKGTMMMSSPAAAPPPGGATPPAGAPPAQQGGFGAPPAQQGSGPVQAGGKKRSEEHTSELQSRENLVCRLLLE